MPKRKLVRDEWKDEMLNPMSPSTPPPEVNLVTELLKAMSDPKAGKAYLDKVVDTHTSAAKAKAAELARLTKEHEDRRAEDDHARAVARAAEDKAREAEFAKRDAELKARERAVTEREAAAEARERVADETKADYNRRRGELARITSESP